MNIDRSGEQVGNYILKQKLGKGGFADVYLGEHRISPDIKAAVKILNRQQLTSSTSRAFENEARAISQLNHPNIVHLREFDLLATQHTSSLIPYIIMDYAPHGSLRSNHKRGDPLPPATIQSYVKQIAAGLQYAHDHQCIHRDIKPENILIGSNQELLLSDFGLAVIIDPSLSMPTQDIIGTLVYMSPEQLRGKPERASDQYSLAVMVYEWICGNPPFRGNHQELLLKVVSDPVPPLRPQVPTLPPQVEAVIMKALDKDPRARYSSVEEFAQSLDRAIARQSQPPPSPLSPPPLGYTYGFYGETTRTKNSMPGGFGTVPSPPKRQTQATSDSIMGLTGGIDMRKLRQRRWRPFVIAGFIANVLFSIIIGLWVNHLYPSDHNANGWWCWLFAEISSSIVFYLYVIALGRSFRIVMAVILAAYWGLIGMALTELWDFFSLPPGILTVIFFASSLYIHLSQLSKMSRRRR